MAGEWKSRIPLREWEVYERGGFGRKSGFGRRPAVVVIDVQYRTVGDEPLPILESMERYYRTSCGETGWRAVRNIAMLLRAARAAHIPVIYPYIAPKTAIDAGRTGTKVPALMEVPEKGYRFVEETQPEPGDLLIPKRHPSAFFGTPLASYLIDMGIDTLLLTGCTTSGCIRATAVDTFAYNFHCGVIEECVYDRSELSHDVNLFDIQAKYADVISLDDAVAYLESVSPAALGAGAAT